MPQWNDICKKAELLLTQEEQKTAFAKYIPHLNDCYGIKYGASISLDHLVAILLCNDSFELLSKTRTVCIRKTEETHHISIMETINDMKDRHSE
eukprot:206774_1